MKKKAKPVSKSRSIEDLEKENEALRARIAGIEKEAALRAGGVREDIIFNTLSEHVVYQDRDGRILWANRAAADSVGLPPREMTGRRCYEVFHGRKDFCPGCPIRETFSSGGAEGGEMESLEGKWWFIKGYPVRDEDGNVIGAVEIARDVTEQRRAGTALRESEELYKALVRTSPDAVTVSDLQGKITHVSDRSLKVHGTDNPDDLIGKDSFILIAPEDRERALLNLQKTFHEGVVENLEYKLIRKDGSTFMAEMNAAIIRDAGGNPKAFIATVRDITERKLAEAALAAEKELLSVTLRSIGDGVITADTLGSVVLVNREAETLTGWSQEEARGRPLQEVFRILDEKTRKPAENPAQKVLGTGGSIVIPERTLLVSRDGTERIIADSGAPIRDRESRIIGVVIVFRNVTEKLAMEEELQRAQKLESIGILAGGIAHDFNNILTAVIGNLSLARLYATPGDEIHERLGEAGKAASIAKDLTHQLLTFSRGGAPVKRVASLRDLLADTSVFALSGSNVRADLKVPDDVWSIECDVGQICQVINNLVINAKQAMPEGGVVEVVAENVTIGGGDRLPLPPGMYVKVSVRDRGVGIAEENLPLIFDPYFTTKERGSGLGLATTYSIVKRHGGCIRVESQVGAGTTFEVFLPATGRKASRAGSPESRSFKGKGRILVMDDEEMVRRVVTTLLGHLGYEVEITTDGGEMLKRYREASESAAPFDAVIMDLTVPGGLGGKEAIRKLLELDPGARAIVSSGYSNDPIMANFRSHGFRGVVAKPYEIDELGEVLMRVLREDEK